MRLIDFGTDLTPFWDSNDTFWQSQKLFDAQKHYYNTDKLGYVYPAFSDVDRNDRKSMQQAAKKVIHRLLAKPQDSIFKGDPSVPKWYNWSVRIRVRKFELGRSFTVLIFLGNVPENPAEWYTCQQMVGRNHVFANSAPGNCENCRRQSNIIHEGFVHLNRGFARLAPQVRLPCAPDVVVPYLKENLNWRVIDVSHYFSEYWARTDDSRSTIRLQGSQCKSTPWTLPHSLFRSPLIQAPRFQRSVRGKFITM